MTILLVTHFMDEAERLCDRLAIVDQGRIVGLDTPAGLVATVAGEQLLRFTPSRPLDQRLLSDLPEVSPGGAGVDAVRQAWFGSGVPWSSVAVLAGFTVAVGGLAALVFRWE